MEESEGDCACEEQIKSLEKTVQHLMVRIASVEKGMRAVEGMKNQLSRLERSVERALGVLLPRVDGLLTGLAAVSGPVPLANVTVALSTAKTNKRGKAVEATKVANEIASGKKGAAKTAGHEKSAVSNSVMNKSTVVDKSTINRSVAEKSTFEKSPSDKSTPTNAEKNSIEISTVDKTTIDKTTVKKSNANKSTVEKSSKEKRKANKNVANRSSVKSPESSVVTSG